MPRGFALGLLVTALLFSGCGNGGGGGSAPNGGRGADNPTGAPSITPGDPAAGPGPAPEQPREAVPEQTEPAPTDEPAATEPPPATEPAADGEASTTAPAAGEISLVELPWEGVQEQIAAHQGKVVVVDLWATYCDPCRASFPGLVTLSKQDPDNIVCLSVSLDDPTDAERRAMAVAFLQEQQAAFTNILCTTDETMLYDEILKIGGIPAVYVYGRDGQMAKLFTGRSPDGGEHTYEGHITPFVTQLAAGGESGQPTAASGQ
ncbi:MAG: hypothetical protein JNG89_03210 [Planctomycetaceae bacterium]|nr:hypothetical protein [Planctomycetaceae bacterium]